MALRNGRKLEALGNVGLFSACHTKELTRIAALTDEVSVPAGFVFACEGRPGHEFFAIADGEARVSLRGRTLATLGAGAFFGEMALLDDKPRSASVIATTPMRVFVLDRTSFMKLLHQSPAVGRKIARVLAQRIRGSVSKAS